MKRRTFLKAVVATVTAVMNNPIAYTAEIAITRDRLLMELIQKYTMDNLDKMPLAKYVLSGPRNIIQIQE